MPNSPLTGNAGERPDALAALLRWEAAGGEWVVRSRDDSSAVVDLITCDGGEVMCQLMSSHPEFVAYVRDGVKNRPDR